MNFPSKEMVKAVQVQLTQEANRKAIDFMAATLLRGDHRGLVSSLPRGFGRKALIDYFAENTEWKLSFNTRYENGDYPGDTEVEYWSLS